MDSIADFQLIVTGQLCPYCGCKTELVSDKDIYGPNSTYGGMYYRCVINHDHYVGTYTDNITSLGRLADTELRQWKMKGHATLDPMWKNKPRIFKNRYTAYSWLSHKMSIDRQYTHFGMFTIEQCKQAIKICEDLLEEKNSEKQ